MTKGLGALAAGLLLVVASGCGGDDGDDSDIAAATTVAPDATTEDTAPVDEPADDGADEGAEDGTAGGDACALLEGVDLDDLLGEPAGEPNDASTAMGLACTVPMATGGSGGATLAVTSDRSAENYENQQELFGVDEEVAGLGDAAFRSGGYLFVLDGERFVRLQVIQDAEAGAGVEHEKMVAAMEVILEHLG